MEHASEAGSGVSGGGAVVGGAVGRARSKHSVCREAGQGVFVLGGACDGFGWDGISTRSSFICGSAPPLKRVAWLGVERNNDMTSVTGDAR